MMKAANLEGILAPCPFGHESSCVHRMATAFMDDTCPRFMCIGSTKVLPNGRKLCQVCNQVFGNVRSELSYHHMNCHRPVEHDLSLKDQDIEKNVFKIMMDFKDIRHDRRWPPELVSSVHSLCVKIMKVHEAMKSKKYAELGELPEEEKAEFKRKDMADRLTQKNILMASAAILWLSLVKDPERYSHIGIAKEIIKMITVTGKVKKRIVLDKVLSRINQSAEMFRRGLEAPVTTSIGHVTKRCDNTMVENVSESFQLVEVNVRLATTVRIYGVSDFIKGPNVTQCDGIWTYTVSPNKDDFDLVAVKQLQEKSKAFADSDLNWAYDEWHEALMSSTSSETVELEFKAGGRTVYVVITVSGGQITDVFSTYMPAQFSLNDKSSTVDLTSIDDFGTVERVGKMEETHLKRSDLYNARQITGNCADGTTTPVWVIDDPGILCNVGKVVLIKEGSSFALGSSTDTYKCYKTEAPRNQYVGSIMRELNHMDPNCSVLGPVFHRHMPENFGKGHVINEVKHLLETARDTFMYDDTHAKFNVHNVSCGFSHHRVGHKGPKIETSFDLFRKEFYQACAATSVSASSGADDSTQRIYYKVGDEFTSVWKSGKGREYTSTLKVLEVWSRDYIDKRLSLLHEDEKTFKKELAARRQDLPHFLNNDEGPIKKSKQVGRKLSKSKKTKDLKGKLWNSLDEFSKLFVTVCVPKLSNSAQKVFIDSVKGFIAFAQILKNTHTMFTSFRRICSDTISESSSPFENYVNGNISVKMRKYWLKTLTVDKKEVKAVADFATHVVGKYFQHTFKHMNGKSMELSKAQRYKILTSVREFLKSENVAPLAKRRRLT